MNDTKYIMKKLKDRAGYDFKNKRENIDLSCAYMYNRTQSMFRYSGLPDTIPARMLELYLQMNGNVCIARVSDEELANNPKNPPAGLYAFTGGMGGEPDAYYMPTIYTVSNPYLNIMKNYNIDKDCVVIPNDSLYLGLDPLFTKFATAKVENELSMIVAMINSRIPTLIASGNDETRKSAETYLKRVADGEIGVIADTDFLGQLQGVPYGNTGTHTLTDLIELEQYIKAAWYNSLGLNANYNMKRESINAEESQLNNDALLPLVDDMLARRREGLEKVNAMFGTNITVDLASSWKDNQQEIDAEQNAIDNGGSPDTGADDPKPDETESKPDEGGNE